MFEKEGKLKATGKQVGIRNILGGRRLSRSKTERTYLLERYIYDF